MNKKWNFIKEKIYLKVGNLICAKKSSSYIYIYMLVNAFFILLL